MARARKASLQGRGSLHAECLLSTPMWVQRYRVAVTFVAVGTLFERVRVGRQSGLLAVARKRHDREAARH